MNQTLTHTTALDELTSLSFSFLLHRMKTAVKITRSVAPKVVKATTGTRGSGNAVDSEAQMLDSLESNKSKKWFALRKDTQTYDQMF